MKEAEIEFLPECMKQNTGLKIKQILLKLTEVWSLHCEEELDTEFDTNFNDANLEKSTDIELPVCNDGAIEEVPVENSSQPAQNDEIAQDSLGAELTLQEGDEPYIGQEFESEQDAQEFYTAYGVQMGFNVRVSNLCRSRRDGSLTSRTLVCNKEGYRSSDKRNRTSAGKQRLATRVGCKAMVSVKKLNSGRWVINKFVKEHNHGLVPERTFNGLTYNHSLSEDARVKELSKQLMVEKKRSASLQKAVNVLFDHIEHHAEHLSEKIQHIVDSVKEVESAKKRPKKSR